LNVDDHQLATLISTGAGVEVRSDEIQIDAAVVAAGLGIELSAVCALMRSGQVTSLCERGEGDDQGRFRLTFFYRGKRFRVTVDEGGRIVRRASIDFGGRPLPALLRRAQP
jgi:hypothetical protein